MATEEKFIKKYDPMLPPKEWKSENLTFFEPNNSHEVQLLSRGMGKAECLLYYNVTYDELESYDQFFFDCNFNRGRIDGIHRGVDNLFKQMAAKSGTNATMEYLTRFAKEWPEGEAAVGRSGFNFKVVLDK